MRAAVLIGSFFALLLAAPAALADPIDTCLRAADDGQTLRDQGHLLAARERFSACAVQACPRVVRKDCGAWKTDIEARIPSVIFSAVDSAGRPLAAVQVSIDGGPTEPVTGDPRSLDPGTHRLEFTAAGTAASLVETLVLRERERARTHLVALLPAPPPPASPPRLALGAAIASIVLGGVAIASGGAFAGLAWDAKSSVDDLRARCAPSCDPAEVDAIRAKEIGANVALGVGAAAAVAAAVILIVHPTDKPAVAWKWGAVGFSF
ncbi:MAG: carboxypeptidase-like regulatory domain-containing protein [Byssovorax sp.]